MKTAIQEPIHLTTGAAFDLADLMPLRAWAEFHGLRMDVDLGHCLDGAACDEIVVLAERHSPLRWMLWRSVSGIVLQPMLGHGREFASMSDVLTALHPAETEELQDLRIDHW